MPEHFVNEGFGWECRRCRERDGAPTPRGGDALPRFFREGEAEGGGPALSSGARARWKDEARDTLVCARCGAEEKVSGARDGSGGSS